MELYHYGIKGMKWRHKKKVELDDNAKKLKARVREYQERHARQDHKFIDQWYAATDIKFSDINKQLKNKHNQRVKERSIRGRKAAIAALQNIGRHGMPTNIKIN